MFAIDSRSRMPIYEQLVENIVGMVANGMLAADDQLPSVRMLARDLGINPNTVQKAYQELEQRGLIYQAAGRGSFVSPGTAPMQVVAGTRLQALRAPMLAARQAGVTLQQVQQLAQEVFREGQDQ